MTCRLVICALSAALLLACDATENASSMPPEAEQAESQAGQAEMGQPEAEAGQAEPGQPNAESPPFGVDVPEVHAAPVYDSSIDVTTHTYAQGQVHTTWMGPVAINVSNAEVNDGIIDLKLDVYEPTDAPPNRPAILIIHGGGFRGGTRDKTSCVDFANYFAARGFVAVSISYRLVRHRGTVPQEWFDIFEGLEVTDDVREQGLAIYPAARDAKAALRWLHANAGTFGVNPNFITTHGGSAGSQLAIALGVTDPADFRDELTIEADPTLASTHLDSSMAVRTIVEHWGGTTAMTVLEALDGRSRFDADDPPMSIVHGTDDDTVLFAEAEKLRDAYIETGVPYAFYPIEGAGHGAWNRAVSVDGEPVRLQVLAFDFIIEQQGLTVVSAP